MANGIIVQMIFLIAIMIIVIMIALSLFVVVPIVTRAFGWERGRTKGREEQKEHQVQDKTENI